ncbi:MAG: fibronectin type III domain-containing protein [Candidatus Peribacteraceae bacterium]|jgi:hypothetical protein
MATLNRRHWYALGATLAAIVLTFSALNATPSWRAQTAEEEEGVTAEEEAIVAEEGAGDVPAEGTAEESSTSSEGDTADTGSTVSLFLRPHCELADQAECPAFTVRDPLTLETESLRAGDILDLDIVVRNDLLVPLSRVRSWLQYDPEILQGMDIQASTSLPIPAPGEEDYDAERGYVMIDVEAESEEGLADALIPVAQVTFTVKDVPGGGETMLTFHDLEGNPPHTAVYTAGLEATEVLGDTLGVLAVRIEENTVSSSSAPVEASSATGEVISVPETVAEEVPVGEETHPAPAEETVAPEQFVLLQVQNVRVTTEGTTLYVAWDALPSPNIRGFHVYYGTQTGRYIQRRTVRPDETGIAIRSLTQGTTYYAAVRGFNEDNEETAFSQEAAVTIGDPTTSTAPLRTLTGLTGNPLQGQAAYVPGDSGLGTTATLLLIASAVMGTLIASRRQTHLRAAPHA